MTNGCRHTEGLQKYFDIENRGIDYINNYGVKFEFKESFALDLKQMFFKLPKIQCEQSDFIVFCVYDKSFFVHRAKSFLAKYLFDNSSEHCCLRYSTISRNYLFKTMSIDVLKDWINARGAF